MIINWASRNTLVGAAAYIAVSTVAVPVIHGIQEHSPLPTYKLIYQQVTPIAAEIPPVGGGGAKFDVAPRRIYIKPDVGEPALRMIEVELEKAAEILAEPTEIIVEGEPYIVVAAMEPSAREVVAMLPPEELAEKIEHVRKALGVTKAKAMEAIEARAEEELAEVRDLKAQLIREDEELALIIIMSEV